MSSVVRFRCPGCRANIYLEDNGCIEPDELGLYYNPWRGTCKACRTWIDMTLIMKPSQDDRFILQIEYASAFKTVVDGDRHGALKRFIARRWNRKLGKKKKRAR